MVEGSCGHHVVARISSQGMPNTIFIYNLVR
jgi:hypothetical protein